MLKEAKQGLNSEYLLPTVLVYELFECHSYVRYY